MKPPPWLLTAPAFFVPLRQLGSAFHAAMAGVSADENLKQVYTFAEGKEKNRRVEIIIPTI